MPRHNDLAGLAAVLLEWFDSDARDLPWRTPKGVSRDPYRVWLSEVMLQQTTVPHAIPYFHAFTARWPTIDDLAAANDQDVMSAWAGLGYYARARNLLKCARTVSAAAGFPATRAGLERLPGIGPYTAGAIAAIAFGEQVAAVDGNVERVIARLLAMTGDWASQKRQIAEYVQSNVPADRPGDFAEALMDLGATVCTPKRPNCSSCCLRAMCVAAAEGAPDRYPIKPKKPAQPLRYGIAYVLTDGPRVLLEQRPDSGLLGGMLGLPVSEWTVTWPPPPAPPATTAWREAGEVRHVFTHFHLRLSVMHAEARLATDRGEWMHVSAANGLPTVFAKALRMALAPPIPAKKH